MAERYINGPWYRHYTDGHRNLKMRAMPEHTQLFFHWLMELRREEKYPCSNDDLAWYLRVSVERVQDEIEMLKHAGRLLENGDIKGWDERQYDSDGGSSTERVRRHRERKKCNDSETLHGNGDETLHETKQIRTDKNRTEQRKDGKAPARPTDGQLEMLEGVAEDTGLSLSRACQILGIEDLTRADVTPLKTAMKTWQKSGVPKGKLPPPPPDPEITAEDREAGLAFLEQVKGAVS